MANATRVVLALAIAILVAVGAFVLLSSANERSRILQPHGPHARHVVLLVLDTVRADRMSVYGHDRPTTPFLEEFAQEALVFDRAKSPAPWTVPAHASLFTALWPAQHQAQWGRFTLAQEHETLAEVLSHHGFRSVGLSSNAFIGDEAGFGQGFDRYEVIQGSLRTRSDRLLQEFAAELNSERRSFFFLNVLDAHIPYNTGPYGEDFGVVEPGGPVSDAEIKWAISAGAREFSESEKLQHAAAYDAAIRYTDDLVAQVVDTLRQAGMAEDTLLIVTSDHGDGLGAHQIIGHSASTWEEQLAIPLIVWFPPGIDPRRSDQLTSTVAVAPTVLDWLGLPRPKSWLAMPSLTSVSPTIPVTADYRSYFVAEGRDINREVAALYPDFARSVHHTHVLYCDPLKLSVKAQGEPSLFDLSADPQEQLNLWQSTDPAARSCYARYRDLATEARFTPFDSVASAAQQDAAREAKDEDKLRSLGYLP